MRKSDKKKLEEKLNALSPADRQRLYKQAARKRKAAATQNRKNRGDLTKGFREGKKHIDGGLEKLKSKGPVSLEDWVLKLLAEEDFDKKEANTDAAQETHPGIVITVKAGECSIVTDQDKRLKCLLRPELAMAQKSDLAVGDRIRYSVNSDGINIVESVEPRHSVLSRPDPHDRRLERVIVTNIDIVVIVASVHTPPLNPNLIDRYLLAINRGGIEPLICVNKIDLVENDEEVMCIDEALEAYRRLGIDIVKCSAESGLNIERLKEHLYGKPAVFVGHSGVGKSSILNAIDPALGIETRTVQRATGKGRHTTVRSNLYHLPGDITIIDTPGVRGFGLWKMEPSELRWYFDEFDQFADSCKYSNCTHTHEPGCAVKAALPANNVLARRYESYLKMLESLG